jgi:hypothetical protein
MKARARPLLEQIGRAAALFATGVTLVATTVPTCLPGETASYEAATDCGPAGIFTLSFTARERPGCAGDCFTFLDAAGAHAVGLPEQGEVADGFGSGFALVGPVPLVGSVPPVTIHRECRFESIDEGVFSVICEGEGPEAACSGTVMRIVDTGT